MKNNKYIVQLLLQQKNINANLRTKNGETPLHIACKNGSNECIKILIKYGVNLNTQTVSKLGIFNLFIFIKNLSKICNNKYFRITITLCLSKQSKISN